MSDIGIPINLVSLIEIALLLGSPGLLLGAIPGALLWQPRRIAGGLIGAVAGFALCLGGWMFLNM